MMRFIHQLASPKYFYNFSGKLIPWLGLACLLVTLAGLYQGLLVAPSDYQQGDSYRIMFIHVPAAWMSMFIYMVMAGAGIIGLVWHIKLAEIMAISSAHIGASFTFLALITGSIWGKPMWGAWWVWDARLTSMFVLFLLYLGYIAVWQAVEEPHRAARIAGVVALVGVINVPIIKFSVEWWNTLHQPSSLLRKGGPAIDSSILTPLLVNMAAFALVFVALLLLSMRTEVLSRRVRQMELARVGRAG